MNNKPNNSNEKVEIIERALQEAVGGGDTVDICSYFDCSIFSMNVCHIDKCEISF